MNGSVGVGILAASAYVPRALAERAMLAAQWGTRPLEGRRSVAAADEDSITLAVEAGRRALEVVDGAADTIDLVILASTTLPYWERQNAGIVASALGISANARTIDVTGSLRSGIDAVRLAVDSVSSEATTAAMVLISDCRVAPPGSNDEQTFGDGAVAFVIARNARFATFHGWGTRHRDEGVRWRSGDTRIVRTFESRLERVSSYSVELAAAASAARLIAGADEGQDTRSALPAVDREVGDWGAAASGLALVCALEQSASGDAFTWGAVGDGASAAWIVRGSQPQRAPTFEDQLKGRHAITQYGNFIADRGLVRGRNEADSPDVSPVAAWRREEQVLGRKAGLCQECGTRQYPATLTCVRCGSYRTQSPVIMAYHGNVFTFTLDHLSDGAYLTTPVAKCVVDLADGTRFYAVMTDADPRDLRLGLPVTLTFRARSRGSGFRNYGWKCRPREVSE